MNLGDMNPGDMNPSAITPGAMNPSAITPSDCQPLQCDKAMNCIDGARNPLSTPLEMGSLRGQLTDCSPCLQAFDMEVRLRTTMSPSMSALPTDDFRMRITETLASVDLSQLDISDF